MNTHPLNPGELIREISDLFEAKGVRIPCITFQAVCSAGSGKKPIYGFWITTNTGFGLPETGELIALFHANGYMPSSITNRQRDIVVFTR